MFQSSSYAIFFIGKRDVVGFGSNLWCCILHGYTHACQFQHAQVVVAKSFLQKCSKAAAMPSSSLESVM